MAAIASAASSSTYTSACQAASFACSTSPSQPSSSARRARSSAQREPALPPAPATLSPSAACDRRGALGVAQRRIGVRQEQVADRRRLGRLQIRVVGGERGARGARVPGERRGLVDERVVQLAHGAPGGEAKPDAERLAARPARAQPAGRRAADAPLQLRLARVEGVAERRIPRELVARDRVQLEQPAQERPCVVAGQVAALDERDRVRQIGEREPVREPRAVRALGGVRSRDQLAGRTAPQPPAAAQLLGLRHSAEPRELGGTGLGSCETRPASMDDPDLPLTGAFRTRSPDRPNPNGHATARSWHVGDRTRGSRRCPDATVQTCGH